MERIDSRMILEVMGRPAEHVIETLQNLTDKLGKERGVTVKNVRIATPAKVEGSDNLVSSFAEIEVEFESIQIFFGISFGYMPSNVEIISPTSMKFSNSDLNAIGNILLSRLHNYEAITKRLLGEREILINRLKHALGEIPSDLVSPPSKAKPTKKKTKKKKA